MSARKDDPVGAEAIRAIEEKLLGLAEGLKQAFTAAEEAVRGGGVHETTIDTPQGPLVARSMVRMRVGGLAANLGAVREEPVGEVRPEAREPLVDSYEEADAMVITAELPGVAIEEVELSFDRGALRIETVGRRRYRATVALAEGLRAEAVERRLVNGILEVRIPKGDRDVG